MIDRIGRALSELDEFAARGGYGSDAPLQPIEYELAKLLPALQEISTEDRARLRLAVDYSVTYTLFGFSIRAASAAVRSGNAAPLVAGALALTLDNDQLDPRDIYRALAVLMDASARVGADGDAIIRCAAECALERRAALMEGYLEAPEYMRPIDSMGFELADSGAGPYYRGMNF